MAMSCYTQHLLPGNILGFIGVVFWSIWNAILIGAALSSWLGDNIWRDANGERRYSMSSNFSSVLKFVCKYISKRWCLHCSIAYRVRLTQYDSSQQFAEQNFVSNLNGNLSILFWDVFWSLQLSDIKAYEKSFDVGGRKWPTANGNPMGFYGIHSSLLGDLILSPTGFRGMEQSLLRMTPLSRNDARIYPEFRRIIL